MTVGAFEGELIEILDGELVRKLEGKLVRISVGVFDGGLVSDLEVDRTDGMPVGLSDPMKAGE